MPTLLVVDDDAAVLEFLEQALVGFGYTVVLAGDGESALTLYNPQMIDAVITDVQMPGLNGIELCQELRARARTVGYELPVWLMTGARNAQMEGRAGEAGAIAILSKPFTLEKFSAELKACLSQATGG